jgi:hypothetical protein
MSITTSQKPRTAATKSLVRHVTLEQHASDRDGIEVVLDNSKGPPLRLSGEHHVGGLDLVNHLHGLSPMPRRRRPRLSSFGHGGYHSVPRGAPSPFACPPSSIRSSAHKSRLSFGNDVLET